MNVEHRGNWSLWISLGKNKRSVMLKNILCLISGLGVFSVGETFKKEKDVFMPMVYV